MLLRLVLSCSKRMGIWFSPMKKELLSLVTLPFLMSSVNIAPEHEAFLKASLVYPTAEAPEYKSSYHREQLSGQKAGISMPLSKAS